MVGLHIEIVLVLLVSTVSISLAGQGDCVGVLTSEGVTTLTHGESACAPLTHGQTEADLGKKYITCANGHIYPNSCSPNVVFNYPMQNCDWPYQATCAMPGVGGGHTSPPDPTTTRAPTTQKPTPPVSTPSADPNIPTSPDSATVPGSHTTPPHPQTFPPGKCSAATCQLPNCFCYGASPSGIPLSDMPQFIMLTFDDAVTNAAYNNYYHNLFVSNTYNITNPDGCRVKTTLYVSHENTDYTKVKAMYNVGTEIASHTIHHNLPTGDQQSHYTEMANEIDGLRDKVLLGTGDKTIVDSIVGFRSPYLRVAHDVQFDVLRDFGFLYDTSILNIEIYSGRKPLWPFTLNYEIERSRCVNPPCPTKPYPGLWEVPLNGWIGDNGFSCSMIDACIVGDSEQDWYNYYDRNLKQYFYDIRVPLPMFTHASMFLRSTNSYPALVRWLQDITRANNNIWLVTPKQVINWMRNPLTNDQMIAQNWSC